MNVQHEKWFPEVVELLILGTTRGEIVRHVQKKGYTGSVRTIDAQIRRGREHVKRSFEKDVAYLVARSIRRHEVLYRKALQGNDVRAALAVERSILEIAGAITRADKFSENPMADGKPPARVIFVDAESDMLAIEGEVASDGGSSDTASSPSA